MCTNSFDGGIWNVYFRKWQLTEEEKKREGRDSKKMIYIEGCSSCANKENGAIDSSHPSDGSLERLYVNSYDVQAPVENNTV